MKTYLINIYSSDLNVFYTYKKYLKGVAKLVISVFTDLKNIKIRRKHIDSEYFQKRILFLSEIRTTSRIAVSCRR